MYHIQEDSSKETRHSTVRLSMHLNALYNKIIFVMYTQRTKKTILLRLILNENNNKSICYIQKFKYY
jgi:hypothetical protein